MTVLAVCQFAPGEDRLANLASLRAAAQRAAVAGAAVLVAPEYSAYMPEQLDGRVALGAEPLDGPFVSELSALAAGLGVAVIAGMLERGPSSDGAVFNTVVAIGAGGDLSAVYRKVHLFDAFGTRESDVLTAGEPDQVALVNCGNATLGIETCYDLRFPESSRVLVDSGATVLAIPAQWLPGPMKLDHWRTLARARAIENTCYVVAPDQAPPRGVGSSMIVDPTGTVLASAGERTETIVADYDAKTLESVRDRNPVLALRRFAVQPKHRRPERATERRSGVDNGRRAEALR